MKLYKMIPQRMTKITPAKDELSRHKQRRAQPARKARLIGRKG
ncbi:hypothetical protein AB0L99_21570 [Streptomyces sp. NPDC051954]